MHCDSETLCTYIKTIAKIGMNPVVPEPSTSIIESYGSNISVYTSKVEERLHIDHVPFMDDDLV
jgi:hypothetical protein